MKIALPRPVLDIFLKTQLNITNKLQEKYRRNDKEVDREKLIALAKFMRRRRGMPLTSEQEVS